MKLPHWALGVVDWGWLGRDPLMRHIVYYKQMTA